MSHFVDTMAYVGELPWHGLGTYLGEENVSGKDMMIAAKLDWRVKKAPIYYQDIDNTYQVVEDQYTIIREDTGVSLGCTVGSKYEPFQNVDLFKFGDDLVSTGEVRWHTAGSLKENRKIWGLAQIAGEQEIARRPSPNRITRDVHVPFLLIYNSHDGSSCLTARLTSVRVVCWNTLSMALSEKMPEFRVRHTEAIMERAEEARELLGLAQEASHVQKEVLQGLADTPFSGVQFTEFCAQLLTGKDGIDEALDKVAHMKDSQRTQVNRKAGELGVLFTDGDGNGGADKKDALDAVTQFIDRQKNRIVEWHKLDKQTQGKRLNAQVFGSGEALKKRALRLLS